jgi:hypothetical protein
MLGGNDMKSDIEADDMRVLRELANKGAEISHADERPADGNYGGPSTTGSSSVCGTNADNRIYRATRSHR